MKTLTLDFDSSEMDEAFSGRLLVPRLMAALIASQDRAVARFGLTCRQGALLLNCAFGEGNTTAGLARYQALDISSVTRMVERLRKKGLLRRTRDRRDRRRVILTVTPEGHALIEQALPAGMEADKRAWHGVTAAEKRALASITEKVLKNVGHHLGPFQQGRID